jgi:hypothetical protein
MQNLTKEEFCIVVSRYNENLHWTIPLGKNCIIYNKGKSDLDYIDKECIIPLENVGREGGTYIKHIIDNYDNLSEHTAFLQGHPFDHINNVSEEKGMQILYDIFNEKKDYNFRYISTHMVKVNENEIYSYNSGIPSTQVSLGLPIKTKTLLFYLNNYIENLPYNPEMIKLKDATTSLFYSKETIQLYEFVDVITKIPFFMFTENGNKLRDELFAKFDFSYILPLIQGDYYFGYGAMFIVSKNQILKYPKSFWINLFKNFQEKTPAAGYGLEKLWPYIFLKS